MTDNKDMLRAIATLLECLSMAEKRSATVYPPQNKGQFVSWLHDILARGTTGVPVSDEDYRHLRQAFITYADGRTETRF